MYNRWLLHLLLSWMLLALAGCQPSDEILLDDARNPHVGYGLEKVRALEYDAAIESFERALKVNPQSIRAHYELGLLYERHKKEFTSALYHYNQVLKLQQKGWPAENVKLLVAGCRRELVKEEVLAPVIRQMQRELESLRDENRRLHQELSSLRAAPQTAPPTRANQTRATPAPTTAPSTPAIAGRTTGRTQPGMHRVKPGETMASISRLYNVKLPSLLASNPHVKPISMPVGTLLKIPGQ